jgi:hypothetical protein
MHKWFAATACPGPYLESKFPYIAEQVNARLVRTSATCRDTPLSALPGQGVIPDLNIRKGPGTNYGTLAIIPARVYSPLSRKPAAQVPPSGACSKAYQAGRNGWISLDYAAKL